MQLLLGSLSQLIRIVTESSLGRGFVLFNLFATFVFRSTMFPASFSWALVLLTGHFCRHVEANNVKLYSDGHSTYLNEDIVRQLYKRYVSSFDFDYTMSLFMDKRLSFLRWTVSMRLYWFLRSLESCLNDEFIVFISRMIRENYKQRETISKNSYDSYYYHY